MYEELFFRAISLNRIVVLRSSILKYLCMTQTRREVITALCKTNR